MMHKQLSERIPKFSAVVCAVRAQAEKDWRRRRHLDAYLKRTAADEFADQADAVLGRQQREKRPRKIFMQTLHDMFVVNCGQPLDGVVATLTEVAFGKGTTAENVRDARKPTKRRDRQSRRTRTLDRPKSPPECPIENSDS